MTRGYVTRVTVAWDLHVVSDRTRQRRTSGFKVHISGAQLYVVSIAPDICDVRLLAISIA